MKRTILRYAIIASISFSGLFFNQTFLCASEETPQETIFTSDKMQKSFMLKILGLISACYGLHLIKNGITEPVNLAYKIIPDQIIPISDENRHSIMAQCRAQVELFNHCLFLFKLQCAVGSILTYLGYNLIINSNTITETKLTDTIKKYVNTLTFGRYCRKN